MATTESLQRDYAEILRSDLTDDNTRKQQFDVLRHIVLQLYKKICIDSSSSNKTK